MVKKNLTLFNPPDTVLSVNENHIGQKAWNRLSRKQKLAIIKNRNSGRKLAEGFSQERWKKNHPHESSPKV